MVTKLETHGGFYVNGLSVNTIGIVHWLDDNDAVALRIQNIRDLLFFSADFLFSFDNLLLLQKALEFAFL